MLGRFAVRPFAEADASVIAAVLDGFPELVVLDLVQAAEHHSPQTQQLLVAVTFPGAASVASGALASWIQHEGFAINLEEGRGSARKSEGSFPVFKSDGPSRTSSLSPRPG